MVEEQNQEQEHQEERVIEEVVGPTPTPPPSVEPVEDVLPSPPPPSPPAPSPPPPLLPPSGFDVDHLPHDPGERLHCHRKLFTAIFLKHLRDWQEFQPPRLMVSINRDGHFFI